MSWKSDVLSIIDDMAHVHRMTAFNLCDIYTYSESLKEKHPENDNIKAKIRQQLQTLRDAGLLTFNSRGHYALTEEYYLGNREKILVPASLGAHNETR